MSTITPAPPTIAPAPPTIAPAPRPVPVPLASLPLRRITVDEYDRIADFLNDPERVELIDGYMVMTMAKKPGHSSSTTKLHETLAARLPAGWSARKEEPVRIPAYDEPEPGVSVVRGTAEDYRQRHPGPGEVGLVVSRSR